MKKKEEHFGVYILFLRSGDVLLVKKTRGPYSGLLDLPGGSPEYGEPPVQTAIREAKEELGISLRENQLHLDQALGFIYEDNNMTLFHKGVVYRYEGKIEDESITQSTSSDTEGSVWASMNATNLSPLVKRSIKSYQVVAHNSGGCAPSE